MPETLAFAAALLGDSMAVVGGAGLVGRRMWLGVVTAGGRADRPRGGQEEDAPQFAVDHADALRRGVPDATGLEDIDPDSAAPTPEIVELHVRGYDRRH